MIRTAKVLERKTLLCSPKRVVEEKLEMADGAIVDWYYLDSPRSVMVVPVTEEGRLVMVRQYRHNLKAFGLEFPAGAPDPKESAEDAAVRELREETGYTAAVDALVSLGNFYVLPSETNRYLSLFLAKCVKKTSSPKLDDLIEKYFEMETVEIEVTESYREIGRSINGLETVCALMLAKGSLT